MKNLIVLSSKARGGKDTFAKFLAKALYEKTHEVYYLVSYANTLKRELQQRFDLTYDQLWGDKKEDLDLRYPKYTIEGVPIENMYWTPREMMQEYGQFFRTLYHNYWVDNLFDIIKDKQYKNVIITDGRHRNEILAVIASGGFHIRIERESAAEMKIHGMDHISENAVFKEDIPVDIVVKNTGGLDMLEKSAYDVVETIISLKKLKETK